LVALAGSQFDYEADGSSININITQSDGANVYSDFTVNVDINDLNDAPEILDNFTISVDEGNTIVIDNSYLETVDNDDNPIDIHYTVDSLPNHGTLYLNGVAIAVTQGFTQQDIIDGLVTYEHNGSENFSDSFDFTVMDGGEDGVSPQSDTFNISINSMNDAPTLKTPLQEMFSIDGDIESVVALNGFGAIVSKIIIHDNDTIYNLDDLSITGTIASMTADTFFEITEPASGEFVLKLKSDYKIIDGGGVWEINNGTSNVANIGSSGSPVTINIQLDNGIESDSLDIDFSVQNIQQVIGPSGTLITQGVATGDPNDTVFVLGDNGFKFITGRGGHDLIKLDGVNGSGTLDDFNFTSTDSNLTGNSADLKSIEEFRFVDTMDTLRINIQDLEDLLRTSQDGEVIIGSGGTQNGTSATEDKNGIYFSDDGGTTYDNLVNNGFTRGADYTDGGETYAVFHSSQGLGDVLIELDIVGAANGGI